MTDVRLARHELSNLLRVYVKTYNRKMFFTKTQYKGEADVPQAHYSDARLPGFNRLQQFVFHAGSLPFE
jgi:hypothetical protein